MQNFRKDNISVRLLVVENSAVDVVARVLDGGCSFVWLRLLDGVSLHVLKLLILFKINDRSRRLHRDFAPKLKKRRENLRRCG